MIVLLTGALAVDKKYIKSEMYNQLNYRKIIYKDYDISYSSIIEEKNIEDNICIKNKEGQILYEISKETKKEGINLISNEDYQQINSLVKKENDYLRSKEYYSIYMRKKTDLNLYEPYLKDLTEEEIRKFNLLTKEGIEFAPYYMWSMGFKDYRNHDVIKDVLHEKHVNRFFKFLGKTVDENSVMQDELKFGTDLWIKIFSDFHKNNKEIFQVFSFPVSEYFINRLIENLGKENVFVINITRNPTCSYIFDFEIESEDEEIDNKSIFSKFFSDKNFYHVMTEKSVKCLFNQSVLKNNPNVTTIKYEELLKNPIINIMGKEIKLPKILSKNNLISQYEHNTFVPLLKTKKYYTKVSQIPLFNKLFSNTHQNLNTYYFQEKAKDIFPNNVFQELGYHPLSFFDICSTRKY